MQRNMRIVAMFGAAVIAVVMTQGRTAAQSKESKDEVQRLQEAMSVLHDLSDAPDRGIPRGLMDRAEAIVVIPTLVKGGFIIGAKHGKGVISVRGEGRGWSDPGFVTMSGGSIGWQIGLESVDLVLLVMNRHGVDDLLSDKFTLGGSASVAAGPVGRGADANTDAKMSSQILAYSRAKGLFAGATLEGASLKGDNDGNESFYGRKVMLRDVVGGHAENLHPPSIAATWRDTLRAMSIPQSAPAR